MKQFLIVTLALCSLLYAEDVVLSGTVKDNAGNSLEGVTVTLAGMGDLSAETDADGTFILTNTTSVLFPREIGTSFGFSFRNNAIVFNTVSDKLSGTMALYSISGKLITSVTLDNLDAARQRLVLPRLSSGSYLLAGTVNNKTFTRSLVCMGNNRIRSKAAGNDDKSASFGYAKNTAVEIVDTLIASKDGYNTLRFVLEGYSRDNLKLVLIDPTAKPVVYLTKDISPNGITAIYNAIGRDLPGKVMVKIHTGEPNGKYFIKPELIKDVVEQVRGTIAETCVIYGGQRASAATNLQVASDHGFTDIADVDILDKDGQITLPVEGGTQLTENHVGKNIENYNSSLVIAHFKGHAMAGLGGAIKMLSIGFASPEGKAWIHTVGQSTTPSFSSLLARHTTGKADQEFLEAMAEAAKSVVDKFDGNMIFINVGKDLTLDCDCEIGSQHAATDADIGILGSLDPVAVDQACADLVDKEGDLWKERIAVYDGTHQMKHGEEIGLGDRDYELVSID